METRSVYSSHWWFFVFWEKNIIIFFRFFPETTMLIIIGSSLDRMVKNDPTQMSNFFAFVFFFLTRIKSTQSIVESLFIGFMHYGQCLTMCICTWGLFLHFLNSYHWMEKIYLFDTRLRQKLLFNIIFQTMNIHMYIFKHFISSF